MGGEINIFSIDKNINYPIAKRIAPVLYKLGIIPNYITIFNVIFRFFIVYKSINNSQNLLVYYLISHFLDCLDGTLARMFNLQSSFGATLDHISDKLFWSFLILNSINICKNNPSNRNIIIIISILLITGVSNCNFRKKCDGEDFIDMNAMLIIIFINKLHIKCIN